MTSLTAWLATTLLVGMPSATAPTDTDVRATIQRSLPYLEQQGEAWIDDKQCVACHRVGNQVWSLGAARSRGFPVSEQLDQWFEWSIESSLETNDEGRSNVAGNKEGVAQLLLARQWFPESKELAKLADVFAQQLASDQLPSGAWQPGGQLPSQKRPKSETERASTQWLWLAATQLGLDAESGEWQDAARAYLEQANEATSVEVLALDLMLADQRGDAEAVLRARKRLVDQQQASGGWGWLLSDEPDALGTGLALYALLDSGLDAQDASVQAARKFLVESQRDDGSWAVRGTKAGKKDRVEETAVYWGTAWAVLGLLESLPPSSTSTP